jgi:DNA-binding NtrC family response regulator
VYSPRVLVVDDEAVVCESCKRILEEEDYEVECAQNGKDAFIKMKANPFDIVITDLKMPGVDGMEVLRTFRRDYPDAVIIMITGFSTVETAVEAMKLGAFDYIPKPFTPDEVSVVVKKALEKRNLLLENIYLRQELQEKYGFQNIVGKGKRMQEIYRIITKVAMADSTVLIYGQSGTGKELIARAIHFNSPRREKPFVPVDCAVLSENLLESELFGHIRGSFTGAVTTKPGLFEVADGGTLFLDEVGNISLAIQAKLLRVLQEREFTPVGGTKSKKVDIRLIAATNKDLEKMIKEGTFREDLYYRLNIVPIKGPAGGYSSAGGPFSKEVCRRNGEARQWICSGGHEETDEVFLAGERSGTGECRRTKCGDERWGSDPGGSPGAPPGRGEGDDGG